MCECVVTIIITRECGWWSSSDYYWLIIKVNVKSSVPFFFLSLSLLRAREFHAEYTRDVAREEGWVGTRRARKKSGNGSPWNCRLILLAPVIPRSLPPLFWHRGTEVPSLRALLARGNEGRCSSRKERLSKQKFYEFSPPASNADRSFFFSFPFWREDASAVIQWWNTVVKSTNRVHFTWFKYLRSRFSNYSRNTLFE